MARTKRSAALDTRNKRLELPIGKRFMETLGPGTYLSYQRPENGAAGSWIARWANVGEKPLKFKQARVGTADDFLDADGINVLTFAQAQKKAEERFGVWTKEAILAAGGEIPHEGPYTVADAMRDYLADAERRGVHGLRIMLQNAEAHILPELGEIDVDRLTVKRVQTWHHALAKRGRIKTGRARKAGEEVVRLAAPATEDERRARKDTSNRILSILKAALNHAALTQGVGRGTNWKLAKPFPNVGKSRVRFLTPEEQQRLVNACPPDFRALVQGALYTGARYGELSKVRVRDFNPTAGTVFIEFGKTNRGGYKPRHAILTPEGVEWFKSFVAGRAGDDLMFTHDVARASRKEALKDFDGWAEYDQRPAMEAACAAAKIGAVSFHELRHTYASGLVNAGVPLAYVASQLGHTTTRMVEKHYGHLCPSAKAESIRTLAPTLGLANPSVESLAIKKA